MSDERMTPTQELEYWRGRFAGLSREVGSWEREAAESAARSLEARRLMPRWLDEALRARSEESRLWAENEALRDEADTAARSFLTAQGERDAARNGERLLSARLSDAEAARRLLLTDLAARDARIAELEALLACPGSDFGHRCGRCDSEVGR